MPYIVPRLLAPTITSARSTSAKGLSTTATWKASHWFWILLTSNFLLAINCAISWLLPSVPTNTNCFCPARVFFNAGCLPVTFSISLCKFFAARTTPGNSLLSITISRVCCLSTSTRLPRALVASQDSSPSAQLVGLAIANSSSKYRKGVIKRGVVSQRKTGVRLSECAMKCSSG